MQRMPDVEEEVNAPRRLEPVLRLSPLPDQHELLRRRARSVYLKEALLSERNERRLVNRVRQGTKDSPKMRAVGNAIDINTEKGTIGQHRSERIARAMCPAAVNGTDHRGTHGGIMLGTVHCLATTGDGCLRDTACTCQGTARFRHATNKHTSSTMFHGTGRSTARQGTLVHAQGTRCPEQHDTEV